MARRDELSASDGTPVASLHAWTAPIVAQAAAGSNPYPSRHANRDHRHSRSAAGAVMLARIREPKADAMSLTP